MPIAEWDAGLGTASRRETRPLDGIQFWGAARAISALVSHVLLSFSFDFCLALLHVSDPNDLSGWTTSLDWSVALPLPLSALLGGVRDRSLGTIVAELTGERQGGRRDLI